jgi:hypothetical protein
VDGFAGLPRRGAGEKLATVADFSNRPQAVVVQVEDGGEFSLELKSGSTPSGVKTSLPGSAPGAYERRVYRRTPKP